MHNWSVDENELRKFPEQYNIWRLEQLINYGLDGELINEKKLRQYLPKLHLDPARRSFLNLLLYGTINPH